MVLPGAERRGVIRVASHKCRMEGTTAIPAGTNLLWHVPGPVLLVQVCPNSKASHVWRVPAPVHSYGYNSTRNQKRAIAVSARFVPGSFGCLSFISEPACLLWGVRYGPTGVVLVGD
eukprot:2689906-Rhodomonas_salina.3